MTEMWDAVAGTWEENADFIDEHMAPSTGVLLDAAGIRKGDDVLDLACGPGGAGLVALSRVGATGSVVLADDAPRMLAAAARRTPDRDRVTTLLCTQTEIPVGEARFDAVINRHGLMFVEDPVAAVREAVRVLKPGRRHATMTWNRRADNPWIGLVLDAIADEFGAPFPPPEVRSPFSLDDPDLLGDILKEGGLGEVRVETATASMPAKSLEDWWQLIPRLSGPLVGMLGSLDPEVRESIHQRAIKSGEAAAERSADGIVMHGSVLIGSGSKI